MCGAKPQKKDPKPCMVFVCVQLHHILTCMLLAIPGDLPVLHLLVLLQPLSPSSGLLLFLCVLEP